LHSVVRETTHNIRPPWPKRPLFAGTPARCIKCILQPAVGALPTLTLALTPPQVQVKLERELHLRRADVAAMHELEGTALEARAVVIAQLETLRTQVGAP
jgi:hypothetical protein